MTQPLRRAHFAIWSVVPVLLAILFAAGLMARRPTQPANPEFRLEKYK